MSEDRKNERSEGEKSRSSKSGEFSGLEADKGSFKDNELSQEHGDNPLEDLENEIKEIKNDIDLQDNEEFENNDISPIEKIEKTGKTEKIDAENLEIEVNQDPSFEDENSESSILKLYQNTLQELKEEISRLNKQIEHRNRSLPPEPTEEELFKLKGLCRLFKLEAKTLRETAEEMQMKNIEEAERIEAFKEESSKTITSSKIENLKSKVAELEIEYAEINKSSEINIADLDKILCPEPNLKFINEFYVNLQKRIGFLDQENAKLAGELKKSNLETAKLKEKLENSAARQKTNEELHAKIKNFENTDKKYTETEIKLLESLRLAREEYSLYSAKPENNHDADSAKNILKDMRNQVTAEENEIESLEFVLQEKKNLARAAQIYGLQRSKTSTKLKTDMELLGLVLIEKEQAVSRLKKEIDEFRIKTKQVQIDIKEIMDKKKNDNR